MKKFNYIFDAFQDLFVGLAVTTTVTILLQSYVGIGQFFLDVIIAFAINYIAGLIVDTRRLAAYIAKKVGIKHEKKSFVLLQVLVNTIIFVTIISICMFVIKVGFTPIIVALIKQTYLRLLVIAYIVGFVMAPLSAKITAKIIGVKGND